MACNCCAINDRIGHGALVRPTIGTWRYWPGRSDQNQEFESKFKFNETPMAITYDELMALKFERMRTQYDDSKSLLYALSVGMGGDLSNPRELPFLFERPALQVLPTMATILARTALLANAGLNYARMLNGEVRLELHRPIAAEGELLADAQVIGVHDKGPDKGAIVVSRVAVCDARDGLPLYTMTNSVFARGDGGIGGPTTAAPAPHEIPDRQPDHVVILSTSINQALLFRLHGDRNPLHADPATAIRAGFARPILHGLSTLGVACRALLHAVCDYDATRIASFDARFSAPVYPGETIATEIWVDGNIVSYRSRVTERNVVVLDYGKCILRPGNNN